MENDSRITRDYELMVILVPDMADEDTQAVIERVNGYITDAQGTVTETLTDSPWGRRRLAYTIRFENVDYRDGYYIVIHFTGAPTSIGDIERELKLDTSVIRYLLVMDDPKAGEKVTGQPQAEEGTAEAAPAEATTATGESQAEAVQVEDAASQTAAEETPVNAPPAGAEGSVVDAADTTEANAVEEVADVIKGEENPAPADGAENNRTEA